MRTIRRILALLLVLLLAIPAAAAESEPLASPDGLPAAALVNTAIPCKSAILMEQSTGRVLFEKDADTPMPPASITKIMTMLLVAEALDAGSIAPEDPVTCSPHAASMGGSQIWFEPGEQLTVHELLKATAVASANDAAVALGEFLMGSEEAFTERMNERAAQLGMKHTVFRNASGLDADGHVSTARDIAILSRELLRHPMITRYTTLWMDTLRGGKTQLVNTNKLVRFYDGATGLKTGTTDGAGSCLAASATRKGLSLIAVVLGSPTSDQRFGSARGLLDYGFANFGVVPVPPPDPPLLPVRVVRGVQPTCAVRADRPETMLVEKGTGTSMTQQQERPAEQTAPIREGDPMGSVRVMLNGVVLCEYQIVAAESVASMTFSAALGLLWAELTRMC